MIKRSVSILKDLMHENGLFSASNKGVSTGYDKVWLRDAVYESLGFEAIKNFKAVINTYRSILNILLKHEGKIDWAIANKPTEEYQYIHARYHPETLNEFWENWGNKQNDAVGAILFKIGQLESKGIKVVRNDDDLRILQKLVYYLQSVEYWHDHDNGMWEENHEVHASSVGACVAGLKEINMLVDVPQWLIEKGYETLNNLLPRESITKETDLALLSLIYPYNIVTDEQRDAILANVEHLLVRQRGVIRYIDDYYYNKNGEAEWCFGFPWLAIIYRDMNRPDMYAHYTRKTLEVMNENGELPELYFADSEEHNENSPLGWGQALSIVAFAN